MVLHCPLDHQVPELAECRWGKGIDDGLWFVSQCLLLTWVPCIQDGVCIRLDPTDTDGPTIDHHNHQRFA